MFNLETSVGSRKSAQSIDVPGETEKVLITNQVTTDFYVPPCTPMAYASFSRPTEVSRLKYLRFRFFRSLMKPFSKITRKRRMALFEALVKPTASMKILDLGGQPEIWDSIETPLNITCLNLPGISVVDHPTHHKITYVEGDACSMPYYQPEDFDFIFSNSVIEHVGDLEKRKQFVNEIQRLSDRYWIQTPSKYFPIEAHCGMPFWWFYPKALRTYLLKKWKEKLPYWTEMVETTTVVSPEELKEILPGCKLKYEWFLMPKSQVAYSVV